MTVRPSRRWDWWCRLAHFPYWICLASPHKLLGRYVWLQCTRCKRTYALKLVFPAKAPPGKTPV